MKKAIKELGDSRVVVHKLTLAPEINPQDKKAFTREVMSKLGQDMGRDLRWFGVEHNNTDHDHIHVVVLGKDRNGTEVKIGLNDIEKAKEHGDRYLSLGSGTTRHSIFFFTPSRSTFSINSRKRF